MADWVHPVVMKPLGFHIYFPIEILKDVSPALLIGAVIVRIDSVFGGEDNLALMDQEGAEGVIALFLGTSRQVKGLLDEGFVSHWCFCFHGTSRECAAVVITCQNTFCQNKYSQK